MNNSHKLFFLPWDVQISILPGPYASIWTQFARWKPFLINGSLCNYWGISNSLLDRKRLWSCDLKVIWYLFSFLHVILSNQSIMDRAEGKQCLFSKKPFSYKLFRWLCTPHRFLCSGDFRGHILWHWHVRKM